MLSRAGRTAHITWRAHNCEPGEPWLLLLHGFADSAACWDPVIPAMTRHAGVLAIDARGHGDSTLPDEPFGPNQQAADAALVLDELRQSAPVVVIGHSMGAATAAALACARPELVRAVVLEDPPPALGAGRPERRVPDWLAELRSLDTAQRVQRGRRDNPTWPDDELEPWAVAKGQVDVRLCELDAIRLPPLAQVVPMIGCPMLLLYGNTDHGGLISMATAKDCAGRAAGRLTAVRFDRAGHNVRREARPDFLAAVDEFLARILS